MTFDIYTLVEVIWLILPAYAANGLVPLLRGKHPVDFGKKLFGKPIFGPGKTWEALIGGSIIGVVIAFIQMNASPYLPWELGEGLLNIVPMSLQLGFLLGFGTIVGDMAGSFIKRRLGLKRGESAPILDQDDFVVGALVFASLLIVLELDWWILLLVITPVLHLIASIIGYLAHVKKEPY
ncbi:MAG: CDP-2,3-bis-(O-geranylgeranyl)-sn-glycerol synthase [Candidatus Aenigmatarchaeota archaeon]